MLADSPAVIAALFAACRPRTVAIVGPDAAPVAALVPSGQPAASSVAGPVDLALVCGHSTWFGARQALLTLLDGANAPPVIAIDGVDWPTGRRDRYDESSDVPRGARQHARRGGVLPGVAAPVPGGGLHPDADYAVDEHGLRNGVRTAVEDVLADHGPARVIHLPGLGGVLVIVPPERTTEDAALAGLLDVGRTVHEHLELVEAARVEALGAAAAHERVLAERDAALGHAETLARELHALRSRLEVSAAPPVAGAAEPSLLASDEGAEVRARLALLTDLHDALERGPLGSRTTEVQLLGERNASAWPAVGWVLPGADGADDAVARALAMRDLGAEVSIVLERSAHARFAALHRDGASLLADGATPAGAVLVATAAAAVGVVEDRLFETPDARGAVLLRDYEPLWAGERDADAVRVALARTAGWTLLATSAWLADIIAVAHAQPVHVVPPIVVSKPAPEPGAPLRVVGRCDPPHPRARPDQTRRLLALVQARHRHELQCAALAAGEPARAGDIVVDLSIYSPDGHEALLAMAAGAVPIAPREGGAAALDPGVLLADGANLGEVLDLIAALAGDAERLAAQRRRSYETVDRFTPQRAAEAQLALFAEDS